MLAVRLLETTPRSADSIAVELQFASCVALRNTLRRYVGLTTRQARDAGVGPVIEAFVSELGRAGRRGEASA
jgi:transcriptional regulator GlxA family with amidase domain